MNVTGWREPSHGATQTSEQLAAEPAAFPVTSAAMPMESAFPDWRERLNRNFARVGDRRWEPLTYVHGVSERSAQQIESAVLAASIGDADRSSQRGEPDSAADTAVPAAVAASVEPDASRIRQREHADA